jgi:protein AATF/BFR2
MKNTFQLVVNPIEKALEPYRVSTAEKWTEKAQASSGLAMQKKFKVINQGFTAVYQQLEHDEERSRQRTRLNKGNISIIGKVLISEII